MNKFTIEKNEYLKYDIQGFYNTNYTGYKQPRNPDYLNQLKNDITPYSEQILQLACNTLEKILK